MSTVSGWKNAFEKLVTAVVAVAVGMVPGKTYMIPEWSLVWWGLLGGVLLGFLCLSSVYVTKREAWKRQVLGLDGPPGMPFFWVEHARMVSSRERVAIKLKLRLQVVSARGEIFADAHAFQLSVAPSKGRMEHFDASNAEIAVTSAPKSFGLDARVVALEVRPRREVDAAFQELAQRIIDGERVGLSLEWDCRLWRADEPPVSTHARVGDDTALLVEFA